MPRAGRLRHRITIERQVSARDSAGGYVKTWAVIKTVYAEWQNVRGRETFNQDIVTPETDGLFVVRYAGDITAADRIVWQGRKYDIQAILDRTGRRKLEYIAVKFRDLADADAGPIPPQFIGNIPDQSDPASVPIDALSVASEFFAGNGDNPVYSDNGTLPAGLSISVAGVITGTPAAPGSVSNIVITLTTTNGSADSNPFTWNITAAPVPPSFIGTIPNQTDTQGQAIDALDVSAEFDEGNGSGVIYSDRDGKLPAGLSISPDGVITGTPSAPGTATGIVIRLTTTAGTADSDPFNWTIDPAPVPPTFTGSTTNQNATVGVPFSYDLSGEFNPGNGANPVYSDPLARLGAGLAINPATGIVEGTPTDAGPLTGIVIRLTTSAGQADSTPFQIAIAPAPVPPSFTGAIANQTDTQGQAIDPLDVAQEFDEGNGTGVTYTDRDGTLPDGLSVDPDAGVIIGTPTVPGSFPGIVIRLTTSNGTADSDPFDWTIDPAPVPPSFTGSIADQSDQVNVEISPIDVSLQFDEGNGTGVTYTDRDGTLPAGLSISSAGVITGTPTQVETATGIVIRLTTSNGTADSDPFNWTVSAAAVPPSFTGTIPDQTDTEGQPIDALDVSLQFDEGNGTGVTYTDRDGTLPAGLSISSAGVITGTPTQVETATGIVIRLTTSNGTADSDPFDWTIEAAAVPPSFTGTIPDQTDTEGQPIDALDVSLQFDEGNGTGVTYTDRDGTLPAGLSISSAGVITGTPTTPGTATGIVIRLTTSVGVADSDPFNWTIDPAPVPPSFTGSIANQADTQGQAIDALDVSLQFDEGNGTGATYADRDGTLPAGLSISAAGVITGTPTTPGTVPAIVIRLTTSLGTADSNPFSWTVDPAPVPPSFTGSIADQGPEPAGDPVTPLATAGEFDPGNGTGPTYSLNGSEPPGLTINANTGQVSGVPTTAGSYSGVVVSLQTSNGTANSNPFTWTIDPANAWQESYFSLVQVGGIVDTREPGGPS